MQKSNKPKGGKASRAMVGKRKSDKVQAKRAEQRHREATAAANRGRPHPAVNRTRYAW